MHIQQQTITYTTTNNYRYNNKQLQIQQQPITDKTTSTYKHRYKQLRIQQQTITDTTRNKDQWHIQQQTTNSYIYNNIQQTITDTQQTITYTTPHKNRQLQIQQQTIADTTTSNNITYTTRISKTLCIEAEIWAKEKLQDIQQESEGTSLSYFNIFLNYIEQFSRSFSLSLALCWSTSVWIGLF